MSRRGWLLLVVACPLACLFACLQGCPLLLTRPLLRHPTHCPQLPHPTQAVVDKVREYNAQGLQSLAILLDTKVGGWVGGVV